MASRFELEVTIVSAKNLKNVNWRHGPLRPYAVVWVDPKNKCTTRVDEEGDDSPHWDQKLVIPLYGPVGDSTLFVDVVHANAREDTKPLIGSARLRLRDVLDEAGHGEPLLRKLELKRPSGRTHGKIEVRVAVREPPRYRAADPYYAPPYGVAPPPAPYPNSYGYQGAPAAAPPPSGYPSYGQPPYGQPAAPPPSGYPSYGQPPYGQPAGGYGSTGGYGSSGGYVEEKKKSKFGGMGTGLAVGAVAGVLGGLALGEGVDYVEDKIADDAADKVEDDLGYDDDY